jgi:hypothetical protein
VVAGATATVIGGANGGRNLISGNGGHGVLVTGEGTSGTTVTNNYIGTDSAGGQAVANTGAGVAVADGAVGTRLIGNVISGNGADGVLVSDADTTGTILRRNFIGTNANGTAALGNGGSGVRIDRSSGNTIGAGTVAEGNRIAWNAGFGVRVSEGVSNQILSDAIFANAAGGIKLENAGNNFQPAPVLNEAVSNGGGLVTLRGQGVPGQRISLQVFNNGGSAPTGGFQGQVLIYSGTVRVGADGRFELPVSGAGPGDYLTATATEQSGRNTSEFSPPVQVTSLIGDDTPPDQVGELNTVTGFVRPDGDGFIIVVDLEYDDFTVASAALSGNPPPGFELQLSEAEGWVLVGPSIGFDYDAMPFYFTVVYTYNWNSSNGTLTTYTVTQPYALDYITE